jgi:hypothetical protein
MDIRKDPFGYLGEARGIGPKECQTSYQQGNRGSGRPAVLMAFSSEVDAGSRQENASRQKSRALILVQSEPKF